MNHIDQKIGGALERVILSQNAKFRIKNKIRGVSPHAQRHVRGKLSAAAVVSLVLASLLVISAAAIGGLTYFRAIYGDKAEALTPYGITIGTSAQNGDVVLTLHESVSDDYATAYIFSIRGLTDAGKSLVINNTLDSDAYETTFLQINDTQYVWPDNKHEDDMGNFIWPDEYPPEITDCMLYDVYQKTASGDRKAFDIGLRYDGVTYDTVDKAVYVIMPIESLREEDCEYYALYIITPETQQLTLTFNGLELSLPEATTFIPGVEIQINGYMEDYFLNVVGMVKLTSDYPANAVLTPLGLYVNGTRRFPLMYKNAVLAFNDGSETELREISNDKAGIVSWKANYFPRFYQGAVYLFNDIMDISTVKSLLFYDEIEFPFDGSAPFVRSSGRTLNENAAPDSVQYIAQQLYDYITGVLPLTKSTVNPINGQPQTYSLWSDLTHVSDTTCYFHASDYLEHKSDSFYISLTEIAGGTLEDEARSVLNDFEASLRSAGYDRTFSFNVVKTGTFSDAEIIAVDCGESFTGYNRYCIFTIYEGKLLTVLCDLSENGPAQGIFDEILKLF